MTVRVENFTLYDVAKALRLPISEINDWDPIEIGEVGYSTVAYAMHNVSKEIRLFQIILL